MFATESSVSDRLIYFCSKWTPFLKTRNVFSRAHLIIYFYVI